MAPFSIREKCNINTNYDSDTFVGIKCANGDISISFPLGYNLSLNDKELRHDIILLMSSLKHHTTRKESFLSTSEVDDSVVEFPFEAYLAVISDFFGRGYFKETEITYKISKRGKIDWNRTIKSCKPILQNKGAYYLDYVIKQNQINENELITLIHEYCVYESFNKIGWLFTDSMPSVPKIKYNYKLFKGVLLKKMSITFNDRNQELFKYMLAIIDFQGDENPSTEYAYGTNQFEYVWESMIDKVYGIVNKSDYYPRTSWLLAEQFNNAVLKPDTIMIYNHDVYVLDAKYYKFGYSKMPGDLPESTSINKQITYGEYIAEIETFKQIHGEEMRVFNAFLMPFDSNSWNADKILRIGEAVSDWKISEKTYERVQGILVDVKSLMKIALSQDNIRIKEMAELIEQSVAGGSNDR